MLLPEAIDPRFDELVRQLRIGRPLAHSELRERVRGTASSEARWSFAGLAQFPRRRALLVLMAALIATGLGVAVGRGLVDSGSNQVATRHSPQRVAAGSASRSLEHRRASEALAPARGRLQQYQASLRVRVPSLGALSAASQSVIRTTRRLGGYIASADLNSPSVKLGEAKLAVRVPIGRVQEAVARFSALGALVSQHLRLFDLQQSFDVQTQSIRSLRREIVRVEAELAKPQPAAAAARLRAVSENDRVALRALTKARAMTLERGRLARVDLTLTTRAAAVTPHRNRLGRTLGKAGSILLREFELVLYALVVVGPLLAAGVAAIAITRVRNRRANERLLER